jgi:putative nucleotidyltransferase with HDIG domain
VRVSIRVLVSFTTAAAILGFAAAVSLFPIRPGIGGWLGISYWSVITLLASALPVRMPKGTLISVSLATVMASVVLGGPVAAGIVAAVGTTELREVRGRIPWYGTLYNHASLMIAAIAAGVAYDVALGTLSNPGTATYVVLAFLAALVASGIYYTISNLLAVLAVSARTQLSITTVWQQDIAAVAPNLIGLAPIAWLMAQIYVLPDGLGWWATLLFVVPLFTTRLAYSRYVETRELFEQTIGALANAVDARDRYTRGHSQRVSHISEAMCRVMGLSEPEIEKIKWAGLLHDIGKIGIRDNVLLKPGPLDREERILMNQHPTIGAEIVAPAQSLKSEAPLIRYHHEWFNGSGYPEGIEALDIPLGARILTVADAYEAMTSSRPYRLTPLTHEQAVGELEKFTGIQFDPEIVPVLVGLDRDILDRPPDKLDELPTMLHADDPRDRPPADKADEHADSDSGVAAIVGQTESGDGTAAAATNRTAAATDGTTRTTASGTAITPIRRTSSGTRAPSGRKGSPPRQALASDDVP